MLPGETILNGAPKKCPGCGTTLVMQVCNSGAGYYVGTICRCGPYSRETDYGTKAQAEEWLEELKEGNRTHARDNMPPIDLLGR